MRSGYAFVTHSTFLKSHRFSILDVLIVLIGCMPAFCQVDYSTATLRGSVLDPQGAVIPGATVTATNLGTGLAKATKSGGDGAYQILALPPGNYQVSIEAKGFNKEVVKSLALTVGQSAVYDSHLKVGVSTEIV